MKKPKKKNAKLTPEQREQRRKENRHKAVVRSAFLDTGFVRVPEAADKELTFDKTTSDFDDLFIWKNVFVFAEYTTKSSGFSEHAKKKEFLYNRIRNKTGEFLEYFETLVPKIRDHWDAVYDKSKIQIRFIYCTTTDPDGDLKAQLPEVSFYDYPIAMYFKAVSSTLKWSARNELLSYLKIEHRDAGENCLNTAGTPLEPFKGSLLPESHSHLGKNFRVVSFYISPGALLERSYVLRKEGWRDSEWLYQRMISKTKVESIREFLRTKKRVFLNNIIVTLPPGTKVVDDNSDTIDSTTISSTQPANIHIPKEPNSIGLIDGQHRVFSYHEGGKNDDAIKQLRSKLNLLVTGIMYPPTLSETQRAQFEAEIFLEINSNQTGAKSDLKQAITAILNPFDAYAVAKRVLVNLNRSGALANTFVAYFYDTERVKTTSVVSYGLRHLVALQPTGPLFARWQNEKKDELLKKTDTDLLDEYVQFCTHVVSYWFAAAKSDFPAERWTYNRKAAGAVLNTTNVIGLINYLRAALPTGVPLTIEGFKHHLEGIGTFNFKAYKSSGYGEMGRDMFAAYFKASAAKAAGETPKAENA